MSVTATCGAARRAGASIRTSRAWRSRSYHSYDHPATAGLSGGAEEAILSAAYKHIPEHGFSTRALGLGARDAGYLDISPCVLPDGAFSLIRYHLVLQRQNLALRSQELLKNQESLGPGAKVAALTWARLLGNKDVIQHWQEVRRIGLSSSCRNRKLTHHGVPGISCNGATEPRPRVYEGTRAAVG